MTDPAAAPNAAPPPIESSITPLITLLTTGGPAVEGRRGVVRVEWPG